MRRGSAPIQRADMTSDDRWRDTAGELLARHLPEAAASRVVELGAGADHRAYICDDTWVVRLSTELDRSRRQAATERDAAILTAVAGRTPLQTPRPSVVLPDEGCLIYRLRPGTPAIGLGRGERARIARRHAPLIAAFLSAVHDIPTDTIDVRVERDGHPPTAYLEEAAAFYAEHAGALPDAVREPVERWLTEPPPAGNPVAVFCHNDLGAEHILVDRSAGRPVAVIDWTDAAIADPAHDLGLLLRDFGSAAFDAVLDAYRAAGREGDDALRERAGFYARCKALEDLRYGIELGDRTYVVNGRDAASALFE